MLTTTTDQIRTLAERFIARSKELEYKGKKRDDAVLDYFVGATVMAEINGDDKLAEHLKRVCVMILSIRGYLGLLELTRAPLQPLSAPVAARVPT